MLTQFRNWGIKAKIMSILLVSLLIFTLSVEILFVPLMLRNLMNERQLDAQQVVEVAYGILNKNAQDVQAGVETPEAAKGKAIALIKSLRFRGQEYFWIHDLSRPVPKMIMHPTVPSLDGTTLDDPQFNKATGKRTLPNSDMIKLDNKNLFVAMNEVIEDAGEGFVTYAWPKPQAGGTVSAELYPKVSFVKKFEPWGWVIGSGIYVDDVTAAVTSLRRLIHIASFFFCLATIVIYYLMIHYVSKPVTNLAHLAKRIASGEYGAQLPTTTNDEVGLLYESLNLMSRKVHDKARDLESANRELELELGERMRAEESLKASEERFRTLVDNSFDVIFVLDTGGVFQFVSPSWEKHFGYPPSDVIGQEFRHFVHPDDTANCFEYLAQVLANGQAATSPSYRVKQADGSWRLFIANGTRHTDSTGATLYIGVGHDISDEKRLEEERLNLERQFFHAQKLESLGIMAGGIAHDFNNLLTAIIGNLELSGMHLDKSSQTSIRIGQAMKASLRAAALTKHMLDYTGRGAFKLTSLDLNLLVKENSDLLRTTVPKTISMVMDTSASLPPVLGDSGQLQQVIMNLINNAAEAIGGEPGEIMIATGVQECDWKMLQHSKLEMKPPPGRYVYLDVTDSGCGMDEETQQRIFEPFYTTKFTGRGLGMSSVMGIVKSHNGAILLYSEPKLGSTFKVLLPIFTGQQAAIPYGFAESETSGPHPDVSGMVLVVDDEEPVREVCREFLHDMGMQTMGAADGLEAVEIFSRHMHDISLVILDLTMPRMDGVTALHELRLLQPGAKILISSGHALKTTEKMFVDDTPDGFIQKPYQLQEIKDKITGIIHGIP